MKRASDCGTSGSAGYGETGSPNTLNTYDPNAFAYFCINARDPNNIAQRKWMCGSGVLADGVTGYAVKGGTVSARSFWAKSLTWGGNTYTRHYEFTYDGLGSISAPLAATDTVGFAGDYGWNLNPRATHAAGFARAGKSKFDDYLAALVTKTSTNRNGVVISPYNQNNAANGNFLNTEINQCQATYENVPDISSNGRIENGILINLQVSPWYTLPANQCSWANDWGLKAAQTANYTVSATHGMGGGTCSAFQLDPTGQNPNLPILGINLNDSMVRRCPTWVPCPVGNNCCLAGLGTVLQGNPNSDNVALKADGTAWRYNGATITGQFMSVYPPGPLTNAVQVVGGTYNMCFRHSDSSVQCTSEDVYDSGFQPFHAGYGGCGPASANCPISSPLAAVAPVQIDPAFGGGKLTKVQDIDGTCAVTADGNVYCWGDNSWNEITPGGDSNTPSWYNYAEPVTGFAGVGGGYPSTSSKVVQIAAGDTSGATSLALMQDGTLRTWGMGSSPPGTCPGNPTGAICNPSNSNNFVQIARANYSYCALNTLGNVWCSGDNYYGSLGNGTTTNVTNGWTEVLTAAGKPLSNVAQLKAAGYEFCALQGTTGAINCWGFSQFPDHYADPITDSNYNPITGMLHLDTDRLGAFCARNASGNAFCFGWNSTGLLGNGGVGISDTMTPVVNSTVTCP